MDRLRSSADIVGNPTAVRDRLVSDGYVYLPGLLDVEPILDVQRQLRAGLAEVGWLDSPDTLTTPRRELRFDAASFGTVYPAVQRVEAFHALAHDSRILDLASAVLGGTVFCHPAKVARISPPTTHGRSFTRPHQDFVVLHVASDVITAWIPITACTPTKQGLRVIPASHRDGFLPTDAAAGGRRPLYLSVTDDDPRWATEDFALGDVVLFHSLTVHGGGPNTSDEIRLSADVRYQLVTDPIRAEFTHPHGWPRTPDWDVLCAGWSTRRWIETPAEVPQIPMPDVDYGDYLSTLDAPPSSLLKT